MLLQALVHFCFHFVDHRVTFIRFFKPTALLASPPGSLQTLEPTLLLDLEQVFFPTDVYQVRKRGPTVAVAEKAAENQVQDGQTKHCNRQKYDAEMFWRRGGCRRSWEQRTDIRYIQRFTDTADILKNSISLFFFF